MKTGLMTKDEINKRLEYEMKLKGDSDNIRAPSFLTQKQKAFFEGIVNYLEPSGMLSNLDVYILAQTAITIDRIQTCEAHINENGVVEDEKLFAMLYSLDEKDEMTVENFMKANPLQSTLEDVKEYLESEYNKALEITTMPLNFILILVSNSFYMMIITLNYSKEEYSTMNG